MWTNTHVQTIGNACQLYKPTLYNTQMQRTPVELGWVNFIKELPALAHAY